MKAASILLGFTVLAASLAAETLTQSTTITASNASKLYNGTGTAELVSSVFFIANLQPFDAALGTLQSFTVKWEVNGLLTGTVGPDTGGSASGSFGGTFRIAGNAYDGAGGGTGGGADAGRPLEMKFPSGPIVSQKDFAVTAAGVKYDPAILAAVTGGNPLAVTCTGVDNASVAIVHYSNVVKLAARMTAKVTLTYTYEPPPRVARIMRDLVEECAAIDWTSTTGKNCGVNVSSDLSDWDPVVPAVSGGTFTEEAVPPALTRRFYRVHRNT